MTGRLRGNGGAPAVIHRYGGRVVHVLQRKHVRLDGGIVLHRAVPVEVVRRQVHQHANIRLERWHQVDLVGRELNHVDGVIAGRRQQQRRGTDIAAHLNVKTGMGQHMARQRGRGGLAVRPGDADEAGIAVGDLAGENFRIANDLRARCARLLDAPVRLGMGQRHARRQHEAVQRCKVHLMQVDHRQAQLFSLLGRRRRIVPGQHLCPAANQGVHGGVARTPEAKHADPLAPERMCRNRHERFRLPQRSFRVARPIRASTTEMIQNRITMVGSFQPFCSK